MKHLNKGYETAKTNSASDEVFTPKYAVVPLIKYIKPDSTIWCPFDKETSNFVTEFQNAGFSVLYSHIDNGEDFFNYEPSESYDVIISNPPFSRKDDVLKRLFELNKPYAILLPIPALQGQRRFKYMKDIQFLGFDKRINFYKETEMINIQKGISFGTGYFCRNFLPKDLILEKLTR